MQQTTKQGLQSPIDAPLIYGSDEESFNSTSLNISDNRENSKSLFHSGSGYYSRNTGSISPKHNVFVLSKEKIPLTPTTNTKARKLLKGKQAIPIWNKFNQFGIQMIAEVGNEHPKTAFGIDFGTKFEGYGVVVGNENNISCMLKLPDKKKIVSKLEERRQLRRARRWRNCRRREAGFDNRKRNGFIAPSQKVIIQSRLKIIDEFFKCYQIDTVALEDVKFNHRDNKWGKNFSTIEIGKTMIKQFIKNKSNLILYQGYDTENCRTKYGYKKSSNKSEEIFDAHCSDALAIATDIYTKNHIEQGKFIVIDDTYRPIRRKLFDTQPSKNGIREKYSSGNFKGIKKGTMCEFGQIVGGTKNNYWIRNLDNKRIGRTHISWLSHHFKTKKQGGGEIFIYTLTASQFRM